MAARRRGPIARAAALAALLALVVAAAAPALAQPAPPAGGDDGGGGSGGGGDSGGGSGDAPASPAPADPPQPQPSPSPSPPPAPPAPTPTCDQLPALPGTARDRCDFYRAHCADADEGSAFPYAGAYWCGAALFPFSPLAPLARRAYVLLALLFLPFLFALLGDTAERYFSPIMACVAQSIPKMRPRFAGVTFVALGNGAPDLSSNASAIRSGEYLLAAGAITGGAMFVQCVVGAQVIAIASSRPGGAGGGGGGVRCAGAMLRDAGVFSVAALSLALALLSGRVGRGYVAWSVALYALYVAWVFAGDEWHAAGRPDPQQVRRSLLSMRERVAASASARGLRFGGGSPGGSPAPGPGRRRAPLDEAGIDDEPELLLPASAAAAAGAPWASADDGGAAGGGDDDDQVGDLLLPPPGLSSNAANGGPAPLTSPSPLPPTLPPARRYNSVPPAASPSRGHRPPRAAGNNGGGGGRMLLQHRHSHAGVGIGGYGGGGGGGSGGGGSGYVDPLTYRQLVWADLAEDDGGEAGAIEASLARREQRRRERRRQRRRQQQLQQQHSQGLGGVREMVAGGARGGGGGGGAEEDDEDDGGGEAGAYVPPKADGGLGGGAAAEGLSPRRQRANADFAPQSSARAGGGGGGAGGAARAAAAAAAAAATAGDADFPPTSPAALRRLLFGADAPPPFPCPPGAFSPWARLRAWLPEDWSARLYARARRAATHGASDDWDDPAAPATPAQRLFRAATVPMLLSTYLAQRATIPLADPGPGYSRGWLLTSVVGFPLWMTAYAGGAGARWWVWLAALAVGLLSSWGLAVYTAGSPGTPPALPLPPSSGGAASDDADDGDYDDEDVEGLLVPPAAAAAGPSSASLADGDDASSSAARRAPPPPPPPGPEWLHRAVPALLALAGFAAGVTWIDAVASQAVSILALSATLARLPQGVVGLTLLAWGNSLGDYFGNAALARAGAGSTAITACFAGPLFNVLISMALGFSARFAKLARQAAADAAAAAAAGGGAAPPGPPSSFRTDSVPVQLTPEVALGCGCLLLYSATTVAVGRACGGRLPPWFATVGRLFYLAYFCAAVAWGLSSPSSSSSSGPKAVSAAGRPLGWAL